MANISVSLNLEAYEGFKFLVEKDAQGNKVYYAGIPVKKLFNPQGTKRIYATAIMIPTPGSKFSDFMLKPMLSAQELQSMSQEDFRALPVLGTCKYMESAVSRDVMKDSAKSSVVDATDLDDIFGMSNPTSAPAGAPTPAPAPTLHPSQFPDTLDSLYYITDNNQILAQAKTLQDALQLFKAQASQTAILTKYEGSQVLASWTKVNILQLGL